MPRGLTSPSRAGRDAFPPPDEVAALAEAVGPRFAPVVWLGAYGGLRWGEITGLRVRRFDALKARTAKTLDDFIFYGCGLADTTPLPNNFCGGLATLSVEVLPHGGDPLSGVLTIECLIGPDVPVGGEEAIKLMVGGFNFDEDATEEPDGLTLFVSKSKS